MKNLFLYYKVEIDLAYLIGFNKILGLQQERKLRFALHLVLTKPSWPESIFFSCLLVFFLPVQCLVFPPQLNPSFCGAQITEDRKLYTDCLIRLHVVDPASPTGVYVQPEARLPERKAARSPEQWPVKVNDYGFERRYLL